MNILKMFRELQKTSSGKKHAQKYRILEQYIWTHTDELFDIVMDQGVDYNTKRELMFFGLYSTNPNHIENRDQVKFFQRIWPHVYTISPEAWADLWWYVYTMKWLEWKE